MKISELGSTLSFGQLDNSEPFRFENEYYLKVPTFLEYTEGEGEDQGTSALKNAVKLSDGTLSYFEINTNITEISYEFKVSLETAEG